MKMYLNSGGFNQQEASVKLEAGETLSEVKLKQKDAQEMLEMLSTLKELRSIRREVARRKGDGNKIVSNLF